MARKMRSVAQVTNTFFVNVEAAQNARDVVVRQLANDIIAVPRADDVREKYVEKLRTSLKNGAEKRGYAEKTVVNYLSEALRLSNTFEDDKAATKFLAGNLTYVGFLATRKPSTKSSKKAAKVAPKLSALKKQIRLYVRANGKSDITTFLRSL